MVLQNSLLHLITGWSEFRFWTFLVQFSHWIIKAVIKLGIFGEHIYSNFISAKYCTEIQTLLLPLHAWQLNQKNKIVTLLFFLKFVAISLWIMKHSEINTFLQWKKNKETSIYILFFILQFCWILSLDLSHSIVIITII